MEENAADNVGKEGPSLESAQEVSRCAEPDSTTCDMVEKKKTGKRCLASKAQKPKRKKVLLENDEVENLLTGISQDMDNALEETARKNQLTAINVRNILRHVITNEDVLTMVWNTMQSEEGNSLGTSEMSTVYEQKLTRSKVRQLCGNDASVIVKPPVSEDSAKKLLEEEFSENESSDEEYHPVTVAADGDDSDEENKCKKKDTPKSPATSLVPVPFEELSEDSSLYIDEEEPMVSEDEDKIALRTRSKLPLNDTQLESIEAAFVAPDITTDMYDSECDDEDWRAFLGNFLKPVNVTSGEADDDDQEDPEYNFLEEDDVTDNWELRNDRAVKVSKKELNELIAELIEATDHDFVSADDTESCENSKPVLSSLLNVDVQKKIEELSPVTLSQLMTSDVLDTLNEQMRMHVQLLMQMNALCITEPSFQKYREASQTLLLELKSFADKRLPNGQMSAFAAANLSEAVHLVMTNMHVQPTNNPQKIFPKAASSSKLKIVLKDAPKYAQVLISKSKAFIYPELLPLHAFLNYNTKTTFTPSEDNLIALALEQFAPERGLNLIRLIQKYLLPTRTVQQIHIHIKNVKRAKLTDSNPIQYYFNHKKAPTMIHKVQPFDANNMVAPYDRSSDQVPLWLKKFIRYKKPKCVTISPAVKKPILDTSAAPNTSTGTCSESASPSQRARYNTILPRYDTSGTRSGVKNVSPLKQITPILKKYAYRSGRVLSRGPVRLSFSPTKKVAEKLYRPLAPKAMPVPLNATSFDKATKTENMPVSSEAIQQDDVIVNAVQAVPSSISVTENSIDNSQSERRIVISNEKLENCTSTVEQPLQKENEQTLPIPHIEGDIVEDGDDLDNEGDLEALMLSSSTICKKQHSFIKKKNKQQRELETSLSLVAPDIFDSDPLRDSRLTHFAQSYIEKVKEAFRDDIERFGNFLQTLSEFESSGKTVMQLFNDMNHIFDKQQDLVNDFVCFLTPEQAFQCGKLKENAEFSQFQTFLRKMEIYQPHQVQKFLRVLTQLQKDSALSTKSIFSAVQPFLRNQGHLIEGFSRLFMDEAPPASMMTDFEEITIPDSDGDINTDDEMVEEFVFPDSEDPYGTKQCPCRCHIDTTDPRMLSCNRHCVKCGIKFIDGRIFLQRGKGLKPAQVIYHDDNNSNTKKNGQSVTSSPANLSPGMSYVSNHEAEDIVITKDKTVTGTIPSATCTNHTVIENVGNTIATCSNICGIKSLNVALPSTSSDLYLQNINEEEGAVEIYDPFALAVQQVMNEEGPAKEAIAEQYGLSFSNPCRIPWTKDEDKCLLETCQKFGATEKAFTEVTMSLSGRMIEDVKHRFLELMSLFTVHGNSCAEEVTDSD